MKLRLLTISAMLCLASLSSRAAEPNVPKKPTIDLAVSVSEQADNDLFTATLSAEETASSADDVAKRVTPRIKEALRVAKSTSGATVKSGGTSTFPVLTGRGKIESWRMRSEIIVESRDSAVFAALVGRLEATLAISNLTFQPSPETRTQAENVATLNGIAAFKARAKLVADSFGQSYRIKQIAVNVSGVNGPQYRNVASKASYLSESSSMAMEAGASKISATVQGQIELD